MQALHPFSSSDKLSPPPLRMLHVNEASITHFSLKGTATCSKQAAAAAWKGKLPLLCSCTSSQPVVFFLTHGPPGLANMHLEHVGEEECSWGWAKGKERREGKLEWNEKASHWDFTECVCIQHIIIPSDTKNTFTGSAL